MMVHKFKKMNTYIPLIGGAQGIAVKLNHRMSLYCRLIRCFIYFPSYK